MRLIKLFESFNFSQINDVTELSNKLKDYNIPVEEWGKGYAKTIDHLLDELKNDECVILDKGSSLIRQIEFVGIKIFYRDKSGVKYYLKEDRQEFRDGRTRRRDMMSSVSEKMKFGEDPSESAIRGIEEELGVRVLSNQLIKQRDVRYDGDSKSYPGLDTKYRGHQFTCHFDESQYKANGYVENQKDKSTYFIWVKE